MSLKAAGGSQLPNGMLTNEENARNPAPFGFVDINAMALNAAISGSILAVPDACLGN